MATIRKRNGRYAVAIRKAGHPPLYKSFGTKRDAEIWARKYETAIDEGEVFDDPKHTLAEGIDRYTGDTDRTLSQYRRTILNWWRDEATNHNGVTLGKRRLANLRRSDFIEARDQLRQLGSQHGALIKPATVNRRMAAISAVLTEAQQWDWIKENVARIKRLSGEVERDRLLSPVEQKRLLKASKSSDEPVMYAFVVCAMSSGARAGELIGLRWKDVDLDNGLARLLNTKNGTHRAAPMRGRALEVLQDIKSSGTVVDLHGDDFVFKNKTGHVPFYYRTAWLEIRDKARLKDFRFHDLRHLAASHLAMSGASQSELMQVMGHKSAATSKRYSHFFDKHIADLGDRLQDRLFGSDDS